MSVHAYSWAWQQNVDPGDKFVLIALCEFADADGVCWPSIATVARMTGKHRATVHRSIDRLVEGLFLVRRTGRGRSNTYQLQMRPPKLPAERRGPADDDPDLTCGQPSEGVAPGATGGVAPCDTLVLHGATRGRAPGATGGVAPDATRTVMNRNEPPAGPPAVDNSPPDQRIPESQRQLGLVRLEQIRREHEARAL